MKRTAVILATGPSLTPAVVEMVRVSKKAAIAVSNAWELAPWATALVSQDFKWWQENRKAAIEFRGAKYSGPQRELLAGVIRIEPSGLIATGTNSALLACHVAVSIYQAERVLLCGVDMHAERGDHFFGPHPYPLKNTTRQRFEIMLDQFARWKPRGVQVFNCTPGSRLQCYQFRDLQHALSE